LRTFFKRLLLATILHSRAVMEYFQNGSMSKAKSLAQSTNVMIGREAGVANNT
jgi:hypothetical protein